MANQQPTELNLIDHDWSNYSNCIAVDPDMMFPGDKDTRGIAAAKAVCAGCPVARQCVENRAKTGDQFGVWGGLTAEEHRAKEKAEYRRSWRARQRETSTTAAA